MADTKFPKPDYPKSLTRKDWDKNKGVIAKMHGKTGIGDALDDLEKAFNKVDWDKLDMFGKRMVWKDVTKQAWDKVLSDAQSEMTGNLAAFSKECYNVRDLCNDVAGDFKKSKTIPKSSTKHVSDMATTADHLGVSMNKNSVSPILQKMYDEYLEFVDEKFIQVFYTGLGKVLAKHKGAVAKIRKEPTESNFKDLGCGDMCRDFTTGLGNIEKVFNKGFTGKGGKAAGTAAGKLFQVITPYANLRVEIQSTDEEGIKQEVLKHCDQFDKIYAAVEKFYSTVA